MNLDEARARLVNVAELARQMGYCRSHVNGVISGRVRPGKRFLRDLEKIPVEEVTKKYVRLKSLNKP